MAGIINFVISIVLATTLAGAPTEVDRYQTITLTVEDPHATMVCERIDNDNWQCTYEEEGGEWTVDPDYTKDGREAWGTTSKKIETVCINDAGMQYMLDELHSAEYRDAVKFDYTLRD
jgi:hypothetical protein